MDGYQFIQAVRNLPAHKGKHTLAIALTALARREDQARAFNAGFRAHLSKPVSLKALIETVVGIMNVPNNVPK
jgi:CheY-like chemotaxis protein